MLGGRRVAQRGSDVNDKLESKCIAKGRFAECNKVVVEPMLNHLHHPW